MVDGENLMPVHSDLYECFIFFRKPESIYSLILAHEVGPVDPEGEFLRGMPGDTNDALVLGDKPHLSFKQILVRPFWDRPDHEAVMRPHLLLAKKFKCIICRGNGAIVMLL